MIEAQPTLYRDIRFRSRLEAKWAAFFDVAGWKWDYEPASFRGWTPDFLLKGASNDVYVEVKPIDWIGADAEQVLQRSDIRKVLDCRGDYHDPERLQTELLIIGNGPQRVGRDWVLGAFVDESWGEAPDWALLCDGDMAERVFDFASVKGAYAHRMGGEWDGRKHLKPTNDNLPERAWGLAINATQWRGDETYQGPIGPLFMDLAKKLRRPEQ